MRVDAEGDDAVVMGTSPERSREPTRSPNEVSKATLLEDSPEGGLPGARGTDSPFENAVRSPEKTADAAGDAPRELQMAEQDRWEAATEPVRRTQDKPNAGQTRPASSASLRRSGGGADAVEGKSAEESRRESLMLKASPEATAPRDAPDEVPVKENADNGSPEAAAGNEKLGEDQTVGAGELPATDSVPPLQGE